MRSRVSLDSRGRAPIGSAAARLASPVTYL